MAIRWTRLPAAMVALPFLVNACVNEPTAAGTGPRVAAARLSGVSTGTGAVESTRPERSWLSVVSPKRTVATYSLLSSRR